MKKLIKFSLISLLLAFCVNETLACSGSAYPVSELFMYRVNPPRHDKDLGADVDESGYKANCIAWQELTSKEIPLKDIYEVVYKMSFEDFEKLYNRDSLNYNNKFSKWITNKDTTILEFLMLAKTNEYIRSRINSAWYYPTMTFGTKISIEEVLERSLASNDKRLRDRYLLQAVRALTTLGRYEECVELWEKEISKLPEGNIMRRLALPYIAGAEFRIGKSEKWIEYFAQLGDVSSIMYCSKIRGKELSYIEAFAEVCSYSSNNGKITSILQAQVRDIELHLSWAKNTYESPYNPELEKGVNRDIDKLCMLSLEMLKNKKIKNRALWYYTLAFLTDLKGDYLNASSYLTMAERCVKDDYLRDSIKVLRIYLDAKIYKYDASYEAKLFEHLKWLDNKIATNINKEVEQKVAEGASEMEYGLSFYYWNDMLRRTPHDCGRKTY